VQKGREDIGPDGETSGPEKGLTRLRARPNTRAASATPCPSKRRAERGRTPSLDLGTRAATEDERRGERATRTGETRKNPNADKASSRAVAGGYVFRASDARRHAATAGRERRDAARLGPTASTAPSMASTAAAPPRRRRGILRRRRRRPRR